MRWMLRIFLCLMACSLAHAEEPGNCTVADSSTRPDCHRAIEFFERLQAAVKADQREKIILWVHFPLRVMLAGKPALIRSRQDFLANYDRIFTPAVRCALLHADKSSVWGRYDGFTVSDGVIWWDGIIPPGDKTPVDAPDYWTKFPMKIITINNQNVFAPGCPAG